MVVAVPEEMWVEAPGLSMRVSGCASVYNWKLANRDAPEFSLVSASGERISFSSRGDGHVTVRAGAR